MCFSLPRRWVSLQDLHATPAWWALWSQRTHRLPRLRELLGEGGLWWQPLPLPPDFLFCFFKSPMQGVIVFTKLTSFPSRVASWWGVPTRLSLFDCPWKNVILLLLVLLFCRYINKEESSADGTKTVDIGKDKVHRRRLVQYLWSYQYAFVADHFRNWWKISVERGRNLSSASFLELLCCPASWDPLWTSSNRNRSPANQEQSQ